MNHLYSSYYEQLKTQPLDKYYIDDDEFYECIKWIDNDE